MSDDLFGHQDREPLRPAVPLRATPRRFTPTGVRVTPKVEWVEISVKSVLNRVQGMPFRWSINPYRGCSHACVYCVDGGTPVLTGDGTTKPLGEIRVGDVIYGTQRDGHARRYVRTPVLAHWSVKKPAYRVVLEDGTELVASGDHRFLTDRGWTFVSGAEHGRNRRPHLTIGTRLIGVGAFSAPPAHEDDYRRGSLCGLLPGILDADGCRNGVRKKPLQSARLLGGLPERLRLLHTVDPAIRRTRDLEGTAVKSNARLRVMVIEPLGVRELYDITTGTGDFIANGVISHNCFARVTHWYLDQDGVDDWSSRIFVKVNAPEVLRRELARPSWRREQVSIGTATDPYQPAEAAYRVTRRVLEALRDFRTPASLVTKSTMVMRDAAILRQLADAAGAFVYFSFTTVDPDLARELEPDVPPPAQRLKAMRALAAAGVPVGVLLAPVLPGITDDEDRLAAVVEAAKANGARSLGTNLLHLGDVVRDAFFRYLEHKHPALVPEYENLYRGKYAPRAYQERVQQVVAAIKRRVEFAAGQREPGRAEASTRGAAPGWEQTSLFGR